MTPPPRRRGLRLLAVVGAGLLLTGCGAARPGVAAQVGDESISIAEVDDAARAVCGYVEDRGSGQAFAMRGVRDALLAAMVDQAVADQIAETYGVEPGEDFQSTLADIRSQFSATRTQEQSDALVAFQSAAPYREAIVQAAAKASLAEEGVGAPSDDQVTARAKILTAQWGVDHDISIDPRFGLTVADGAVEESEDPALAFAVSSVAKTGVKKGSELNEDTAYADSLPRSQRCGA